MTDLRRATTADWASLLAIERACFGEDGYSPYFLRMAPLILGDHLWVARSLGRSIGYTMAAFESATPSRAWLLTVAVLPAERGRGVGAALCERVLADVEAAGATEIALTVEPTSPARALYERLGFIAGGVDEGFFGPGNARLVMRRTL